jgi:AcrR family transcriptional regulator
VASRSAKAASAKAAAGKTGARGSAATTGDELELRSQGKRTMKSLLDAGIAVLTDKGYHAARVDDIVNAANLSHGTFYLYFSNKEDLLRSMALQCADEMLGVIDALGPVDPGPEGRETVRAWLVDFLDTYRRYGVVIRAWMEGIVTDHELVRLGGNTFGAVTSSLVGRIRAAGAPHIDHPELAAAALLALIERFTYFVTSRGIAFDDEEVLDTLALVVHRGFFGTTEPPRSRAAARP